MLGTSTRNRTYSQVGEDTTEANLLNCLSYAYARTAIRVREYITYVLLNLNLKIIILNLQICVVSQSTAVQ